MIYFLLQSVCPWRPHLSCFLRSSNRVFCGGGWWAGALFSFLSVWRPLACLSLGQCLSAMRWGSGENCWSEGPELITHPGPLQCPGIWRDPHPLKTKKKKRKINRKRIKREGSGSGHLCLLALCLFKGVGRLVCVVSWDLHNKRSVGDLRLYLLRLCKILNTLKPE